MIGPSQPTRDYTDGIAAHLSPAFAALLLALTACAGAPATAWEQLFDGRSLRGWAVTDFGGEGEVRVEAGRMLLDWGNPLTGVTWQGPFPTTDYEVALEAARLDGDDFFCAMTFPVDASHCTLVLGGWGGSVVGLSCIDGADASQNATSRDERFDRGRVYRVRLRVTGTHVRAWLDDRLIVEQPLAEHTLSLRPEVDASRPFGLAAFATQAALAAVRMRRL